MSPDIRAALRVVLSQDELEEILRHAFRAGVNWAGEAEGYARFGDEPAPDEYAYLKKELDG